MQSSCGEYLYCDPVPYSTLWHRATYSLIRLTASIFREKDWWRYKTEAADRPEALATLIGLQEEFIQRRPVRRWSCTLTGGDVLLHSVTDLRVVPLTRTVANKWGWAGRTANTLRATHNYPESQREWAKTTCKTSEETTTRARNRYIET